VRRLIARSVPIAVMTVAGCLGAVALDSSLLGWRPAAVPSAGQTAGASGAASAEPAADRAALYVDPRAAASRWLQANPGDPRVPLLREKLASQSQGHWVTDPDPARASADVLSYVEAAAAAQAIPVLVLYALPDRDCGGASAGGAPSWSEYGRWVEEVAGAIGTHEAVVILEPDSLALQTCLTPDGARARHHALSSAVDVVTSSAPRARVFLDGGHSAWHPAPVQAARLRSAGIDRADGFASNVSNYRWTAAEIAYGGRLRALLGQQAEQVIDTGRNGAGPLGTQWCDPEGRRLGPSPTLGTGVDGVAAYLWVKPPGEADGCAAAAGTFLPEAAAVLAGAGPVVASPGFGGDPGDDAARQAAGRAPR
jgi:endoglucanase